MTNLFTYVSNDNISSFLENESNYLDKIAFLGDTKKIRTKGHEYGGDHGNSKTFYGTCDTVAATTEKAVVCDDFTEDDLVDGVMVIVKFSEKNTGAVASLTLNVNNTGAFPIKKNYTTSGLSNLTSASELAANAPISFIYNGTYWVATSLDYNNTYTVNYSIDAGQYKAGSGTYAVDRYSLLLQKLDGTWERTTDTSKKYTTATTKTVNTNGFLLNQIVYYSTTTVKANGALLATNTCYRKAASVNMAYSTNCSTTPGWAIGDYIYLVGSLHSDGLFYLDTTQWWSNTLPTTNDGKLYIRLGLALTTTDATMSFFDNRLIFYHDGERICQYLVADNKQDIISDLDEIRSNASNVASKVSRSELSAQSYVTTTTLNAQSYVTKTDLSNQSYITQTTLSAEGYLKSFTETDPTVPTYVKSITESDITNWNSKTSNEGTITGIKMNGVSKGTSGIVDLGTVITYHQNLDNYVTIVDLSSQAYLTSFTETDPTVPTYVKSITESDITNWNSKTSNAGTITGITMNGVSKGTSGVVDLGTVITSHQSLDDYATKTYVGSKFSELVNSAPDTLNTLNELAAALGNDPNFATTVSTEIGTKVSRDELSGLGYVTQTTLSSQAYLQSETDPIFVASVAHGITSTDISNWNDKVSKQYLEEQAYLQSFTEKDPTVPTYVKNIKESNISNWNAYQTNVIETISVNSSNITPVGKNVNIIIPTLSKGTTSGNGNAVTDISVNSHEITLTKGATFLESHQSIKSLNNVSLSGNTDNITLTIVKEQTPESGFLATYKLKQGDTQIGASINIPKDYLIKSGEVKTVTTANTPYNGAAVGDKYLDFTVNVNEGTASDTHMYIPVNDLVDVYTEGNGIDISNSNVVSIQIDSTNANGLATTSNGLKLSLASGSSAGAMSSSDFTKLSGIPSISSANNGQILQVVNGAWTLVSPVTVYTGSDAPNNNNGNNGDIYLQS